MPPVADSRVRVALPVGLAICLAALSAEAWAFEATDRTAIQAVIDRQIDAFRHDDASAAYALASPGIQRMFPDSGQFMEMVRQGYAPVYHPRAFTFGDTRDTASGLDQAVRIEVADGTEWEAVYSFERAADGAWKISGCMLIRARDQSV